MFISKKILWLAALALFGVGLLLGAGLTWSALGLGGTSAPLLRAIFRRQEEHDKRTSDLSDKRKQEEQQAHAEHIESLAVIEKIEQAKLAAARQRASNGDPDALAGEIVEASRDE